MKDILIGHDLANLAKEKGFNERVIHYYTPEGRCTESEGYMTERLVESDWNNGEGNYPTMPEDVSCSAPTQSLLQKWLREKHNLIVIPNYGDLSNKFSYDIIYKGDYCGGDFLYKTYEEALEIGLLEALKSI